jgi:hypothetical protein
MHALDGPVFYFLAGGLRNRANEGKIDIMFHDSVRQQILLELERGAAARQAGLEGRARVCARRAAAAAAREYLTGTARPAVGSSAMDLLEALSSAAEISDPAQACIAHLLLRVDEGYALPPQIDLLEDARSLFDELVALGA